MSSSGSHYPVFLLGFPRSGTTLLRLFLDAHSQLAIPFESFVLIEFYKRQHEYADLSDVSQRLRLVDDMLAAKGISAWDPRVARADLNLDRCTSYAAVIDEIFNAYARHCGKSRWGEKTPLYTTDFHILNELFPDARFVHLVRDGRDAALSLVRQRWGANDLLSALEQWRETVGWARKMGRMLPRNRYLEVRYEDLVMDTERVLREISSFVDLDFEPAMLERQGKLETKLPQRSMEFHANLQRPVDRALAFEWRRRLSAADQAIAVKIAGPLLADLGYPVDVPPVSKLRVQGRHAWRRVSSASQWRLRKMSRRRRGASRS